MARPKYLNLLTAPLHEPLVVSRVIDQDPAFLRFAEQQGLVPGHGVAVVSRDPASDAVAIAGQGRPDVTLGARAASKILVNVRK